MDDDTSESERAYLHLRSLFSGIPEHRTQARKKKRSNPADGASTPFGPGREPRALSGVVDELTARFGWDGVLSRSSLIAGWAGIVGPEVAAHTQPISVEGAVLVIGCESTAWATQLRLMRSDLAARIEEQFPAAGILTIQFKGPDAPSWKRGPRSIPGRGPRDTYG